MTAVKLKGKSKEKQGAVERRDRPEMKVREFDLSVVCYMIQFREKFKLSFNGVPSLPFHSFIHSFILSETTVDVTWKQRGRKGKYY